jgi:hypothetical protein
MKKDDYESSPTEAFDFESGLAGVQEKADR